MAQIYRVRCSRQPLSRTFRGFSDSARRNHAARPRRRVSRAPAERVGLAHVHTRGVEPRRPHHPHRQALLPLGHDKAHGRRVHRRLRRYNLYGDKVEGLWTDRDAAAGGRADFLVDGGIDLD